MAPKTRHVKKGFQAPFKTPHLAKENSDDFDSLAATPRTPAIENPETRSSQRKIKTLNKRTIKEAELKTPSQPCKSARFTTPVTENTQAKKDFDSLAETPQCNKNVIALESKLTKETNITETPSTLSREAEFKTPAQGCRQGRKSSRLRSPVSEKTKSKQDFDSLAETPQSSETLEEVETKETPSAQANRDFYSLGDTPATKKSVPQDGGELEPSEVVAANVELEQDTSEGSPSAGRSKRMRTQTSFFGDVKDSSKVDMTSNDKRVQQPDSSSDSAGDESSASSVVEVTRGGRERIQRVRRKDQHTIYTTRLMGQFAKNDRFLEIHEVPYHPALARHRGWETDGVRAWVKPHPLPLKLNITFTDNEIQAARNFSPGPPVCPWLIRSTCHGRYPLDELNVRIGLQMRRKYQIFALAKRRRVERVVQRYARLQRAMRIKLVPRSEKNIRRLFLKVLFMAKNLKLFSTRNFVDCLDLIGEINLTQYWFPRAKPLVQQYLEKLADRVLDDMDDHRFSPLFREAFDKYHIPYTGKGVIPRGSKIRVIKPGSGPPFLTPEEFKKKFGVYPRAYTDEELTRRYDRTGNVIGHFTVPTLRELLTPIKEQNEEEIEKEETPLRERRRKIGKWLHSNDLKRKLYDAKKIRLAATCKESGVESDLVVRIREIIARSHDTRSHDAGSHVTGSYVTESHVTESHVTGSHATGSHDAGSHVAVSHDAVSLAAGPHDVGSHVIGSHVTGSHDTISHDTGSCVTGSRDTGSHAAESHDRRSYDAGSHNAGSPSDVKLSDAQKTEPAVEL